VLRSSAVRPGAIDFSDRNYLPEGACRTDDLLSDGDLLVTRLSGSLEYVGNCAIATGVGDQIIAYPDRLFRARILECVHPPYVELAFAAKSLRGELEEAAKSSAGHQRISMSDLRRFLVPLPSLEEQRSITERVRAVLRSAEGARELAERVVQSLAGFDHSIHAKAFLGELVGQDPNDEPATVLLERIRAERGPKRAARTRSPARGGA
jgi:type I restriction enzyme, S subunit